MSEEYEVDMSVDPFDDVVEIEPTEEVESEESSEQSEEAEDDEIEGESGDESEDEDEDEDSEDSESEDEQEDVKTDSEGKDSDGEGEGEEPLPEYAKAIEDGSLEIDVNGESLTLKELKNDHIGQKEISRRFTELDIKDKQHEADKNEINEYISTFAGHLKNGDAIGAMQYFGEFAGSPPHMIKEQLIAALTPEIMRRQTLSPTEIQNEYLNNQNEYLTQQRESDNERRMNEQANMELSNSINEIRETNGISEEEWQSTKAHLEKTLADGEGMTPELVKDTVIYGRMYEQAESIVTASTEKLDNADKWIEELVNVKEQYPDFTDDDLKEVLANAVESSRKSSTEQKMAEKLSTKKVTPKKQTKQTNAEDEIDPELDDWL